MSLALDKTIGVGVLVGGHLFNNLQFADAIALLAGSAYDLQLLLDSVSSVSLAYGMEISGPKTQTMCISKEHEGLIIKLYGNDLQQVTEFTYLGSRMAENNSSNAEVCTRIAKALSLFGRLQSVWKDKGVSLTTKVKLLQTLVFPTVSYACEMWTLKTDVIHRLEAFEMQCYCHLLNIKWQDHIINVEVLTQLGSFIKLRLLPMIRKCQAEWLGHVVCMPPNWLPNIALLGYTPGKLQHGHHPKRWIEDVLSHLNLNLKGALRAAKDRKRWKTMIRGPNVF